MAKINLNRLFKKYGLTKTPVFELNTNRQYLIGIDHTMSTKSEVVALQRELKRMGINNLIILLNGNPSKGIKIIKSKAKFTKS